MTALILNSNLIIHSQTEMNEKITSCARIKPLLGSKEEVFFRKYQEGLVLNTKTGDSYKFGIIQTRNFHSEIVLIDWVFDGSTDNEEVFSSILEPHISPFLLGTNRISPFLTHQIAQEFPEN